jgi:pimeloyl-ACP methyl ester carboxylesterase
MRPKRPSAVAPPLLCLLSESSLRIVRIMRLAAPLAALLTLLQLGTVSVADDIVTIDRLVSHKSTVPAVAGKSVDLFVREKVSSAILNAPGGKAQPGKVALFVHGGFNPATVAFDIAYRDYSWMTFLARAGYDVFAMDMTGYGQSSRPMMDDPCNLDPRHQERLVPRNLKERCNPSYPFELVSSDSETADIRRVVDFIRALRGVDKITLIGWSGGGIRTGTYTVRYPETVDKWVVHASSNYDRKHPDGPPAALPKPGFPMVMQVREVGERQRWLGTVKCQDTIEPGMPELIWKLTMDSDTLAANWGPGGLRAPTRTYWGWNATSAAKIKVPTLIMVGEEDDLIASNRDLHADLGAQDKAFLAITCATHYVNWEKQHRMLKRASLEWLEKGTLVGQRQGIFRADADGNITRSDAAGVK